MGEDYFCESGHNSNEGIRYIFYPDDPLWDGDGCIVDPSNTCCSFNNPPYFTKQLPSPTTDDIEARLCSDLFGNPIEFIELYVLIVSTLQDLQNWIRNYVCLCSLLISVAFLPCVVTYSCK